MIGSLGYKRTIEQAEILRKTNMKIFSAATLISLFFASGAVAAPRPAGWFEGWAEGYKGGNSNNNKLPGINAASKIKATTQLAVCQNAKLASSIRCKACDEGRNLYNTRVVSCDEICNNLWNLSRSLKCIPRGVGGGNWQ